MQLEYTSRSRKPSFVQNPIRFVPRQVILPKSAMADSKLFKKRRNGDEDSKERKEKKDKKKKAKSSEETLVVDFPKGAMENRKKDLLCSIAAFLESSGFHRTLSLFRSEAEIENEGSHSSLINLEDLFCRHSKYSEGTAATAIDWSREIGGISRKAEGEKVDDASEHIHKKKTKQKVENDGGIKAGIIEQGLADDSISLKVESRESGDAKDLKKFKAAKDSPTETIDKKKKSILDSNENAEINLSKGTCQTAQDTDVIVPMIDMKNEAKKKNKHKINSDAGNGDTNGEDHNMSKEIVDNKIGEVKSSVNSSSALPAETDAQYKAEKKKKKKKNVSSKVTIENGNNEQVESDSGNANEEKLDNSEKHRKRKRTISIDGPSVAENETVNKKLRHVKVERSEDYKESGNLLKPEKSDSELGAGDEKNTEKSNKKESGGNLAANGNLEKNENLGGSSAKSTNKEKRSAEPKTVNAFQRVKIDQVKFADERLQDNSYWASDEKGSGYGARAQEVLGQVRGRDFRHEKTKKKRGSYRGGQIDFQSHSIKFNSDDDE